MNQYEIRYVRDDMPGEYIGKTSKWAKDEKSALKYILKKSPEKDGKCYFKKGGSGKILSIERLKS